MSQNNFEVTLDGVGDLYIYQPQKGYRFSVDSLLLYLYSPNIEPSNVMDIGAGAGILSFLFALNYPNSRIFSYEIQEIFVHLLKKGIEYNSFSNIEVFKKDIRDLNFKNFEKSLDLIVSNPPYRKYGHGRLSPYENKNIAIYNKYLKISDIFNIVEKLMDNRSYFSFINIYENYEDIKKVIEDHKIYISKEIYIKENNMKKFVVFHITKNYRDKIKRINVSENEWKYKVDELYNK